jgi:hypothetical protein
MRELKTLKTLAESKVTSSEERSRRAWLTRLEDHIDRIDSMVHGNALAKILSDGKFPGTEANAMIKAFEKFENEFHDLEQALLSEFTNIDE